MKWTEEENSSPAGRTPKSLFRLCAEMVSNALAVKALPVIELYFMEDEFSPTEHFSNKRKVLEHLCTLMSWYWKEGSRWFGYQNSEIRLEISRSMSDILDFHSAVVEGPRDQQLFSVFICQMMFQFEAGKLLTSQKYGVDHLCRNLDIFLKSMNTLNVTALYNCNLYFFDPYPLELILRYTPYLERIRLDLCFDDRVMKTIRLHCCLLKEIVLDCTSFEPLDDVDDYLCKTFFNDVTMDEILQKIKNCESVALSFPKLELAWFHSTDDWDSLVSNQFIFLLQHFYKGLRTKWTLHFEDDDALSVTLQPGVYCPPFVKANDGYYFDEIVFHSVSSQVWEVESPDPSFKLVPLSANHVYLFYDDPSVVTSHPNFLKALQERFSCKSLALQYCMRASEKLGQIFGSVGKSLKELHLIGYLHKIQDVEQLYLVLNTCVNLTYLGLHLKIYLKPVKKLLNTLLKLEELSIKCEYEPGFENLSTDITSEENETGNGIHQNMQTARQNYFLIENGRFQRQIEDTYEKIYHRLLTGVQNTYQASEILYGCGSDYSCSSGNRCEVRERFNFNSGPKYESSEGIRNPSDPNYNWSSAMETAQDSILIPTGNISSQFPEGTEQGILAPVPSGQLYGYGVLEYKNLVYHDSETATFTGYRKPAFAFYGHSNYGYKLSHKDLPNPEVTPNYFPSGTPVRHSLYLENLTYNGLSGIIHYHTKHHNNLSQNIKDNLVKNRSAEDKENPLRTKHPFLDSDAQLSLIQSIVSASPNLKVLELQDLRIPNVSALFQNSEMTKNLAKVHTLFLSSKFSPSVIKAITAMPSLKHIRINLQYGIDNFLMYKSALKRTNLIVEIDDDSVLHV